MAFIEWINGLHVAENALHSRFPAFSTASGAQVGAAAACSSAGASVQLQGGSQDSCSRAPWCNVKRFISRISPQTTVRPSPLPSPAAPKHLPCLLRRTPPSVTPGSEKSDVFFAFPAPERDGDREQRRGEAAGGFCTGSSDQQQRLKPGPSSWNPCIPTYPPPESAPPLRPCCGCYQPPTGRSAPARTSPMRRSGCQQASGASHPPHGTMQQPELPGRPATANGLF